MHDDDCLRFLHERRHQIRSVVSLMTVRKKPCKKEERPGPQ